MVQVLGDEVDARAGDRRAGEVAGLLLVEGGPAGVEHPSQAPEAGARCYRASRVTDRVRGQESLPEHAMAPSAVTSPRVSPAMLDWFRTVLVIVTTVGAVFLAYGKLSASAETAVKDAAIARAKAESVEKEVRDTKEEFIRAVAGLASDVRNVKTILDERLPKPQPSVVPATGPR